MKRFLALTWLIAIGAVPWACSDGTTSSDDAGVDATLDHAVDATKDVAVDAIKQDAPVDALADVVDAIADASDAGDLDATDDAADDDAADADDADASDDASDDANDADPDATYDAGLCGSCPTSEVCCTIIKSFNYGKCYNPACLACCM